MATASKNTKDKKKEEQDLQKEFEKQLNNLFSGVGNAVGTAAKQVGEKVASKATTWKPTPKANNGTSVNTNVPEDRRPSIILSPQQAAENMLKKDPQKAISTFEKLGTMLPTKLPNIIKDAAGNIQTIQVSDNTPAGRLRRQKQDPVSQALDAYRSGNASVEEVYKVLDQGGKTSGWYDFEPSKEMQGLLSLKNVQENINNTGRTLWDVFGETQKNNEILSEKTRKLGEMQSKAAGKIADIYSNKPFTLMGNVFDVVEKARQDNERSIIDNPAYGSLRDDVVTNAQNTLKQLQSDQDRRRADAVGKSEVFFNHDYDQNMIGFGEDPEDLRRWIYNGGMYDDDYDTVMEWLNPQQQEDLRKALDDVLAAASGYSYNPDEYMNLWNQELFDTPEYQITEIEQRQAEKKKKSLAAEEKQLRKYNDIILNAQEQTRGLEHKKVEDKGWQDPYNSVGAMERGIQTYDPDRVYSLITGGTEYQRWTAGWDNPSITNEYNNALLMNDNEKELYKYYYENGMLNEAMAFHQGLNDSGVLASRYAPIEAVRVKETAKQLPIASNIVSQGMMLADKYLEIPRTIAGWLGDESVQNMNSAWYGPAKQNDLILGATSEKLTDDFGGLAGKTYSNMMNSLRNLISAYTSPGNKALNLLGFGAQVAQESTYKHLKDNEDYTIASIKGAVDGAFEVLEELLPYDTMLKNQGSIVRDIVRNGLAEFGEEATGAFVFDPIEESIFGENSLQDRKAEIYAAGGYYDGNEWVTLDPDKAKALKQAQVQAMREKAQQGIEQALGGMFGGTVGAVYGQIGQTAQTQNVGKRIQAANNTNEAGQSGLDQIMQLAKGMKQTSQSFQMAQKIQEAAGEAGKASNYQVGKLAQTIMQETGEAQQQVVRDTVQRAIRDRLAAQDVAAEKAEEYAKTIADNLLKGGKLSKEAQDLLAQDERAIETWKSFNSAVGQLGLSAAVYQATEQQRSIEDQISSLVGKTTKASSAVATEIEESIRNTNSTEEAIADFAKRMPNLMSESYAKLAQEVLKADKTAQEHKNFLDAAMKIRMAAFTLSKTVPASSLGKESAQKLYEAAKKEFEEIDRQRIKNNRILKPGEGFAVFDGARFGTAEWKEKLKAIKNSNLRTQMEVLGETARRMGMQLRFVQEANKGIWGMENGASGEIVINMNAATRKGFAHSALVTMSHEMTHWLEHNSLEGYNQLREYILDNLRSKGYDVAGHIWQTIQNQYAVLSQDLTDEEAENGKYSEELNLDMNGALADIVARSCENLLGSQKMALELARKNPGLYGRVSTFVKDFLTRMKEAVSSMPSSLSYEAGLLVKETEKIADLWTKGFREAGLREGMETKTGAGAVSYSLIGKDPATGRSVYLSNFEQGTQNTVKQSALINLIQNVWSKNPISLTIKQNGKSKTIQAKFNPDYDPTGKRMTDVGKMVYTNIGPASRRRVIMNLADDYHQILSESKYSGSMPEKKAHTGVKQWHYFIDDIYYVEQGSEDAIPYRITINVKETNDGDFVYSYTPELQKNRQTKKLSVMGISPVNTGKAGESATASGKKIPQNKSKGKSFSVEQQDTEYQEAVESGNLERATEMLMDRLTETEGIIPFNAPHGYSGQHRDIAKLIKEGTPEAVARAAADMAQFVPENGVLIPMPPHEGTVETDTDTMILANAISKLTGRPVVVALESDPRESRYQAKSEGRKGVTAAEMGFRQVKKIPEGTMPIFVDNVVGSGVTADAARTAMGGGITLAYAKGTQSKGIEGLKRATVTYDKDGKLIPLSQRFDRSIRNVNYSMEQLDEEYEAARKAGDEDTMRRLVNEAANRAMKDSVARYDDETLIPVTHGTNEEFNIFDTSKHGGEHGKAEGFGIYLTDRPEVSEKYGKRQISGFFNAKRLAHGNEVTIKARELTDVIRATCEEQAREIAEEEGYDNWQDALRDTWISNYIYTPDYKNMNAAYRAVADQILKQTDNDNDIIREVMAGMGIREYDRAMDFYHRILTPITGIDGMWTEWKNYEDETIANIFLAFNSNQIKSADLVTYDDNGNVIPLSQRFNPENPDIRYSVEQAPDMDVQAWMAGLTPGSLQTEDERALLQAWKDKRMSISLSIKRQLDYRAKIKRLENSADSLTPQEREDLVALRNKLQVQEEKQARLEKEMYQITSQEGFAGMMYQQNMVMRDFITGRTQDEINDTVDDMVHEVQRMAGEIAEARKDLEKLAEAEDLKQAQKALKGTQLNQNAKSLKKEYRSKMTENEIQARLAEMALRLAGGESVEDVAESARELAYDLARLQNGYLGGAYGDLADRLKQVTIVIGKEQRDQLNAQHSSIPNLRRQLAGSGVKVVYDPELRGAGTLEDIGPGSEIHDLIPELGEDTGNMMNNLDVFVGLVQGTLKNLEAEMLHDFDLDDAAMMIQGYALLASTEMQGDPAMTTQVKRLLGLAKGEGGKAGELAERLKNAQDYLKGAIDKGEQAKGLTKMLRKDVDSAISYYNKTAAVAAKVEKQKVKEGLIAQLKSEHAKALYAEQEKWKELIKKDKKARETAQDNLHMRSIINTDISRLRKLIMNETDQKNIPEEAKPLARQLLKMLGTHDFVGYRKVLLMQKKEIQTMMDALNAYEKRDGEFDAEKDLRWLIIAPETEYADYDAYDQVRQDLIDIEGGLVEYRTAEGQGLISLMDRNAALKKVQKAVTEIYDVIRAKQEVEINGRRMLYNELAQQARDDMKDSRYKGEWVGATKPIGAVKGAIVYGNMTPEYFFKNLKNKTISMLWGMYHKAENQSGLEIKKAKTRLAEIAKETGFENWDQKKEYSFQLAGGGNVKLTLGEMMSLYATWQREMLNQAEVNGPEKSFHLELGGFYVEEKTEKKAGREKRQQQAHKVTKDDMAMIKDAMTPEQLSYVNQVVGYLSNEMAELGNEASMRMFGIKKFNEEWYFPFEMWSGEKSVKSDAGVAGTQQNRVASGSASRRRVNNARNALVIRDFTDVAVKHINWMITYNTFAPAIETMQRVMNTKLNTGEGDDVTMQNVRTAFGAAYGSDALKYYDDFQMHINGGAARVDKTPWDLLLRTFRKISVAGSLSVTLQQPLSYIRAANLINGKYLVAAMNPATWRGSKAEMEKYSGVAVIKSMGKFDMNYGESAVDYMSPQKKTGTARKVRDWIADKSTKAPEVADTVTWTRLWTACKMEQQAKNPEMDHSSDEFLEKVAERFNEVMRRTQVYDSVLVKSKNMRSSNPILRGATSFMGEPTLSINVIADAYADAVNTKGARSKLHLANAGALFLMNAVVAAAIKGIMGAGRTPDKKKTLLENFLYRFEMNLLDEANIFSNIPGYSDLISLMKGEEINDDAYSVLTKLFKAAETMEKWVSGEAGDPYRYFEDSAGVILQIFSRVPLKNIMRDTRAMYNWFIDKPYANRETSAGVLRYQHKDLFYNADNMRGVINTKRGDAGYQTTNAAYYERLWEATKKGDEKAAAELEEYLTLGRGVKQKDIATGMRKAIKNDQEASAEVRVSALKETGLKDTDVSKWVMEEYKAGRLTEQEAKKAYMQANPKMDENDVYFAIERKNYENETGEEAGTSDYFRLDSALDKKDTKAVAEAEKELRSHGYSDVQINEGYEFYFKDRYKKGDITKKAAEDGLKKYVKGITNNDIFWILDRVDYQKETGRNPGSDAYYYRLYDAMDANKAELIKSAANTMMKHGYEAGKIKAAMNAKYKAIYLSGDSSKKKTVQDALEKVYRVLGFDPKDVVKKTIYAWTAPEKKTKKKK